MSLYEKIYNVMCESEALEKSMIVGSGTNSYRAISESAVLNSIKPLLKKHKLILFPVSASIVELQNDFKGYKDEDKTRLISQVVATYKIVDVETGESEILATVGNGADPQDKGSGKAWTYAYKALLQKTFCLFSGEDTDNTHSDDVMPTPKKTTLTQEQFNELLLIGNQKGYDAKIIEKSLVKNYGHGMEYLTKTEYDKSMKELKALPDKK